jgi:hypothetical protein
VEFIDKWYKKLHGRIPLSLREDFCGTAALSREWVKHRRSAHAYGVDLDPEPLKIGYDQYLKSAHVHETKRLHLVQGDVLKPMDIPLVDVTCAFNFSYFIFKKREDLIHYFKMVKSGLKKQGMFILRSPSYLVINAAIGKLIQQIGFDTLPRVENSALYSKSSVGNNLQVFAGNFDTEARNYRIQAPGIVNLLGYRYLILRCKEMEDHLLGSYAYINYTPGIGLFKLASSYNDVTHLRFDFVNLVRKPFHPIGKLSKLTFRFETQDGNLYDFKGVNHQMLFVIKFLTPTQKVSFNKGILNPNYNPNFMNYMSNHRTIEYKEDSDDEDDFSSHTYETKYKKEIQQYDYSTSDSEGNDDEEGSDDDDSEIEFDFSRKPST